MAEKVKFQEIELSKIKAAPYNPRIDLQEGDPEFEKLRRSIEEFGFVEPLIINKNTGYIIGGHQRAKVLEALGYKKALCAVVDLTPEQEKALNIGLNKIGGDWDYLKLKDLLAEIDQLIDVTLTGFDIDEIDDLYREYFDEDNDVEEEESFDPEAEAEAIIEPVSKPGDLWQLGPHFLLVGDATRQDDVIKLMNGKKVDLVISDPPYNVAVNTGTPEDLKKRNRRTDGKIIQNDEMSDREFLEFLTKTFANWRTVMKAGAPFYIYHADSEGKNFRTAVDLAGLELKQNLIWVKNAIVMGRQDYHWQHEPILYGWKGGAAHKWYGRRDKSTVYDEDLNLKDLNKKELIELINQMKNELNTTVMREHKPHSSKLHPTMKPLKLLRQNLLNSSRRGDIILDTFMGSGSTLIAAEQIGRVCYGIEYDPIYSDVIIKRYEKFTGEKAVLLDGQTNKVDPGATS
jgi:DNA modification methylase